MTSSVHALGGKWYWDTEIMALRQAAVEEVRKYADSAVAQKEKEITSLQKQLQLAESLIPLERIYLYDLLRRPESYGGSD
jgi:hypothetical protein